MAALPPLPVGADLVHVIDHIYLGAAPPPRIEVDPGRSVCAFLLDQLHVGYVINVAAKREPSVLPHVVYYSEFTVDDTPTPATANNLFRHLPNCLAVIDTAANATQPRKAVYIHCNAGKSRSAAIVLGVLIVRYKMSLKQAWNYLSAKRPSIYPQPSYFKKLQEIEVRTQ